MLVWVTSPLTVAGKTYLVDACLRLNALGPLVPVVRGALATTRLLAVPCQEALLVGTTVSLLLSIGIGLRSLAGGNFSQ